MRVQRVVHMCAGTLVLAAVPLALLVTGCGSERGADRKARTVASEPRGTTPVSPANVTPAVMPEARYASSVSSAVPVREEAPMRSEAASPDIIVTASDTLVAPGETIELVAQATVDVTQIALFDGLNDRQAFVYDSDAKAWRVSYRVPLKLPWERVGLSVTARNDANRWRRVWVFVRVHEEGAESRDAGPEIDTRGTVGSGS